MVRNLWENLTQRVMNEYFLGILLTARHTRSTTKELSMWKKGTHDDEAVDVEFSKVPDEAIEISNGKMELMSQVKQGNEEDAVKSPEGSEEPGPSITPLDTERRVVDVVSGTPRDEQRSRSHASIDINDGSNMEERGPSNPEVQVSNGKHKRSHILHNVIIPLDFGKDKARLVVQGYNQEEGIDYRETCAHVERMEAIRILIAFPSHMEFKLFQMDVKSAFLNGYLKEEIFVKQPPNFESHKHSGHVFKLDKALYDLKQAPRSWY
ncbi:uncharacterized protein LOC132631369 [Lycium barbarum]|uniref:uncharacterized protein LOC132631369 n=1 Tax=Lycium barbarum TaxID=112863 RepID=UPI00293EFDD2|nr:uncharacterized protein LOC132631369 [Lycium barbarum]